MKEQSREHLKPLIKWPGGKSSEIGQLIGFIPSFERYVEPFVGGGALYFHLEPECALINDNSAYLMAFYDLAAKQDPAFKEMLEAYAAAFERVQAACEAGYDKIYAVFRLYQVAYGEKLDIAGAGIHEGMCLEILREAGPKETAQAETAHEAGLFFDEERYRKIVCEAVGDKMRRTVMTDRKHPLTPEDLKANLITGFTGGFYLYFREVFNRIAAGTIPASDAQRAANFFFVREYCYGSMFRYNAKGEFNIPYGGISYNKKDFRGKIDRIFDARTAALLSRTRLFCMDFEEMLEGEDLTERDFLFLDPPYDTEFSEYEGKDFTKKDHERLAAFLGRTKAKFLLVIKNTAFIYALYEGKFPMYTFENRYIYNVRSRNDRSAEHLIITNCAPPEGSW